MASARRALASASLLRLAVMCCTGAPASPPSSGARAGARVAVLVTGQIRFDNASDLADRRHWIGGADVYVVTYPQFAPYAAALTTLDERVLLVNESHFDTGAWQSMRLPTNLRQWALLTFALLRFDLREYDVLVRWRTELSIMGPELIDAERIATAVAARPGVVVAYSDLAFAACRQTFFRTYGDMFITSCQRYMLRTGCDRVQRQVERANYAWQRAAHRSCFDGHFFPPKGNCGCMTNGPALCPWRSFYPNGARFHSETAHGYHLSARNVTCEHLGAHGIHVRFVKKSTKSGHWQLRPIEADALPARLHRAADLRALLTGAITAPLRSCTWLDMIEVGRGRRT
jgi:hypothetical protein